MSILSGDMSYVGTIVSLHGCTLPEDILAKLDLLEMGTYCIQGTKWFMFRRKPSGEIDPIRLDGLPWTTDTEPDLLVSAPTELELVQKVLGNLK